MQRCDSEFRWIRRAAILSNRVIGFFCVMSAVFGAEGDRPCEALGQSERAKVLEYVRAKYKVAARVDVVENGFLGGSCYRRLQFTSAGASTPFQLELIASPDVRFLARELMDVTVDPVLEERQKQEALAAALRHGTFPTLGAKAAPVQITVFSDFQCPYCARAATELSKVVAANAGTVRVAYRYFPLSMHRWAAAAAEAAACAADQGDAYFWGLHDYLFEHQRSLTAENLQQNIRAYTGEVQGLDLDRFASCVEGRKMASAVEQDRAFGSENGVKATPTVFVNGTRAVGYQAEQIQALIREASAMK